MIARPWINEHSPPARWLAGVLGSARAHESRIDLLVATRNVVRQLRRSAMGLFAVGCGVVAYLLAAGFIEWMHWGLREATIRSGLGHVQIVRAGYRDGGRADPYKYLLPDDSADRKAIGGMAGVVTVAPRFAFSGLISLGDNTLSFIAEGLTPELEGELADAVITVEGAALSSADPDGIVLGRGLAAALGANVGDTVVLVSGIASGGVNAVQGKVRGMFATVSKAYDDSALRITLPMAQRLKKASGSHEWVVLLRDTDQTDSVAASIRKRFASAALEVTAWYDLADFYNKTVTLLSRQVNVVKWMIAIIIVLGITNTMMMTVMERTGEIGTSMALGAKRVQILRRFIAEGMIIGVLGGIAGVLVGLALAAAISKIGIPMPPPPGATRGYSAAILITWPLVVNALVLAVVTTLIAGLYPAFKASRMNIVDALRRNR